MNRFAHTVTTIVALTTLAVAQHTQAAALRTVALTAQQAPGAPAGVTFSGGFVSGSQYGYGYGPVLNDAGQVAFAATLAGADVDSANNRGIWSEGSGNLMLVARTGSPASGDPPGAYFTRFEVSGHFLRLNNAGQTAFSALNTGGNGFWLEGSGTLAPVARVGAQAPDGSTWSFAFADGRWLVLNNAGQTAFRASTTLPTYSGIWSEGSGQLALVAHGGGQAPGLPTGVTFSFGDLPIVLNDAGQTAFQAALYSNSNYDGDSIWSEASGSLALVARRGDPVPGTSDGEFYDFRDPAFNNAGHTAFFAQTNSRWGIWSDRSGSLAPVVLSGDQAPGMPTGVTFYSGTELIYQFWDPVLNNVGQTAFRAYAGPSTLGTGIWSEGSGSLALVAFQGDHAPGTPDGVNFKFAGVDEGTNPLKQPFLNDAGQIAFSSYLMGSGVDSTNNLGIWASDTSGALQLIARAGDVLEVAPGDFRTISRLMFGLDTHYVNCNDFRRPSALNNLGQLSFVANFTDGTSGVFVSNAVAHLPGDFNHDGIVDAADYVVWRKNPGGIYNTDDYNTWRAHFGQSFTFGSGAGLTGSASAPTVPEPGTIFLLSLAVAGCCLRRSPAK